MSAHAEAAPLRLVDAHCHLGFMADGDRVAAAARAAGAGIASMTVTPEAYAAEAARFAAFPNVVVGAGLHPWWAAGSPADGRLDQLIEAVARARVVGEVGLDFSARHAASADDQLQAFREVARACAREGGRVLSIHAVRAAGEAIDVLDETGCFDTCTCVFHWFSGTSDDLSRAVRSGCFFSVGERMLATRRGRAYANAIPGDRLLLETDAPPVSAAGASEGEGAPSPVPAVPHSEPYSFEDLDRSLRAALDGVAAAREGKEDDGLADRIARTSAEVFGLPRA